MGLSWTKRHVGTMSDALDSDYDSLEEAASAALDAALSIIEERAKFAVVGQVYWTPDTGRIEPDHPEAVKVCLGFFESDTKANEAAAALTSNAAGDRLRTWVVPTFFGTASGWHGERRKHYAALEEKADAKRQAKMEKSIAEHQAKMLGRAAEIRAIEQAAGGQQWPCPSVTIRAGNCAHDPTCK